LGAARKLKARLRTEFGIFQVALASPRPMWLDLF